MPEKSRCHNKRVFAPCPGEPSKGAHSYRQTFAPSNRARRHVRRVRVWATSASTGGPNKSFSQQAALKSVRISDLRCFAPFSMKRCAAGFHCLLILKENINHSKAPREFSMQNKEPKRGDPSGYAFGVKCSATLSGERHSSARKEPAQRVINVWS